MHRATHTALHGMQRESALAVTKHAPGGCKPEFRVCTTAATNTCSCTRCQRMPELPCRRTRFSCLTHPPLSCGPRHAQTPQAGCLLHCMHNPAQTHCCQLHALCGHGCIPPALDLATLPPCSAGCLHPTTSSSCARASDIPATLGQRSGTECRWPWPAGRGCWWRQSPHPCPAQ